MRATGILRSALLLMLAGITLPAATATGSLRASVARVGPAPGAQPLELVLPLSADLTGLRRLALAISTPGTPQYHQYVAIQALARRFGAPAPARRRVVAFLKGAGASGVRIDATGLFADATLTAGRAERLFGTSLARFATARGARFTAPAASITIPAGLQGLITGVVGLDTRRVASGSAIPSSFYQPASGTPSGCASALAIGAFTPNQYLSAYGYKPLHAAGVTGQGERVALIEIDGFKDSDINTFAHCFGLRVPEINGFGVGVRHPLAPGPESTLDLEVLDAAAPGLKAIDVYESSADAAHTLRALTAPLQNSGFKPQVISASLGLCEQIARAAVGAGAILGTEGALEEASASGITFLASSGDAGSADCEANGVPLRRLAVNYPASSWWVAGVGGTNLVLNAANAIAGQRVWNDTFVQPGSAAGGGRSVLFSRPFYQQGLVAANRREVPDVAMLADIAPGYAVYCTASRECVNPASRDPWQSVGGTSAGTPLLAGGLALVDEELRLDGRQDLGLVNPLLYAAGRSAPLGALVFSDVTAFGNDVGPYIPGNGQPLGCCSAGSGYDDASGWGSVNLTALSSLALAVQPAIVNVSLGLPTRQRPVRAHRILATVSCSGACLLEVRATIRIAQAPPFTVFSRLYQLRRRGQHTVPIGLGGFALRRLRVALSRRRRITAAVAAVIFDAGGNLERRSRTLGLRIRS
ncbi:MAG: S53 family peptidase [Solirubrobacteraceae bacterium]